MNMTIVNSVHVEPDGVPMATIELRPHNEHASIWYLVWSERNELIGRVTQGEDDRYRIAPEGPHWGPMKSFAAKSYENPDGARCEVQLYFLGR